MEHARREFDAMCYAAVKELLNKSGVRPADIGVVITNSSLFNPTPSLSASVMNHFKVCVCVCGCARGRREGARARVCV